jgi:hypothetical protein
METDLSLSGVIDLALAASDVAAEDIVTADLGTCCISERVTASGKRIMLPQPKEIETLPEKLKEKDR